MDGQNPSNRQIQTISKDASGKNLGEPISLLQVLTILTGTFRSEATLEILESSWRAGVGDLTPGQLKRGLEEAMKLHKSAFMPSPGQFREWALAQEQQGTRLGQGCDLSRSIFTRDSEGREYVRLVTHPIEVRETPALPSPEQAKSAFQRLRELTAKHAEREAWR